MIRHIENRQHTGYEIQFYDSNGNSECVTAVDTLEEVAKVLISVCNGNLRGNYPTVWYNGALIRQ